jgi:hypothetical protein
MPSAANRSASARPMPLAAPVTTATLSRNSFILRPSCESGSTVKVWSPLAERCQAGHAGQHGDTGDERCAWMNRIQAVAKARLNGHVLTYEVYELR